MLNLSVQTSAAVVITTVIAYALITNGRPPVIRDSLFVFVAAIGRIWYRQTSLENALAISTVLVLAWNPSDLFDVGAQISFLVVLGIIVTQSWRFRFGQIKHSSFTSGRMSRDEDASCCGLGDVGSERVICW